MSLVETVYIKADSPGTKLYYDPSGRESYGYIKDGYVYKDSGFNERIDVGSIVPMANGTYIRTAQGSMRLEDYLSQSGGGPAVSAVQPQTAAVSGGAAINSYGEALKAASEQRTKAEISALEALAPKINAQYDDIAKQAYRAYRSGEKGLADSLASTGLYNSGYSDTLKTVRESAYGENVNSANISRSEALAGIDAEIAKQRQLGTAELAEIDAEVAKLRVSQENSDRQLVYDQYWKQLNYDAGRDDESWARTYKTERDAVEDAAAQAALDYKYAQDAAKSASSSASPSSGSKAKAATQESSLSAIKKAELERDASLLAKSYYKNGDQYSRFLAYIGGDSAKKIYEKMYGKEGYDYLVERALEEYDKVRAVAEKAGTGGNAGISLSAAQAQSLAKSLYEQAVAGGLSGADIKKKLDDAGFDGSTRVLIDLYLGISE